MYTPGDVTLYVPCFNAGASLPACLEGVVKQTALPGRVLLVDDGSTPPVSVAGREVVRHPVNRGLASARNTALSLCRTHLIASLDADVVPASDWLENLLDVLNNEPCAGAGGRLLERHTKGLADRWRAAHMAQNWGPEPVRHPRFLFGANTVFHADVLREVGGYDSACRTNNEDRTLCDALYAAKYELLYAPHALSEHLRKDSICTVLRGFWQWHHARGLKAGDFESPEGLIDRMGRVNFGIFSYRFNLDMTQKRDELFGLDLMIPWVFCSLDLALFETRHGAGVPDLAAWETYRGVPEPAARLLKAMLHPVSPAREPWHGNYRHEFERQLRRSGWLAKVRENVGIVDRTLGEAE